MGQQAGHFVTVCVTLMIAAVISWYLFFKEAGQEDSIDVTQFPKVIGTWEGVDLPISKDDLAILETNNVFVRRYTNSVDKSQVFLYIVYSRHNRKVSHPPEICYTGNGMTVNEKVHDPVRIDYKNLTIDTNRLHLTKGDFDHLSYYWFKIGDQFTSNYWKQQALIALNTILGKNSSSALIRVSADISQKDIQKTQRQIKAFINLVAPEIFAYFP